MFGELGRKLFGDKEPEQENNPISAKEADKMQAGLDKQREREALAEEAVESTLGTVANSGDTPVDQEQADKMKAMFRQDEKRRAEMERGGKELGAPTGAAFEGIDEDVDKGVEDAFKNL